MCFGDGQRLAKVWSGIAFLFEAPHIVADPGLGNALTFRIALNPVLRASRPRRVLF